MTQKKEVDMPKKGFRPVVKEMEDTMMAQSGIKPSAAMVQNMKDMQKKDATKKK
jgi:uncharacterized protein YneF (UPF0154 family)